MLSKTAAKKEEIWPASIIWGNKALLSLSLALVCKKPKKCNTGNIAHKYTFRTLDRLPLNNIKIIKS